MSSEQSYLSLDKAGLGTYSNEDCLFLNGRFNLEPFSSMAPASSQKSTRPQMPPILPILGKLFYSAYNYLF